MLPNGNLLVGDRGFQAGSTFLDGALIIVNPVTGIKAFSPAVAYLPIQTIWYWPRMAISWSAIMMPSKGVR